MISITGVFGVKPAAREAAFERLADGGGGGFADRAAMLADQEHHRVGAGMIADAGDEGVAAFDAVDEPVLDAGNRARDRW